MNKPAYVFPSFALGNRQSVQNFFRAGNNCFRFLVIRKLAAVISRGGGKSPPGIFRPLSMSLLCVLASIKRKLLRKECD